jgi:hypothetical protein
LPGVRSPGPTSPGAGTALRTSSPAGREVLGTKDLVGLTPEKSGGHTDKQKDRKGVRGGSLGQRGERTWTGPGPNREVQRGHSQEAALPHTAPMSTRTEPAKRGTKEQNWRAAGQPQRLGFSLGSFIKVLPTPYPARVWAHNCQQGADHNCWHTAGALQPPASSKGGGGRITTPSVSQFGSQFPQATLLESHVPQLAGQPQLPASNIERTTTPSTQSGDFRPQLPTSSAPRRATPSSVGVRATTPTVPLADSSDGRLGRAISLSSRRGAL